MTLFDLSRIRGTLIACCLAITFSGCNSSTSGSTQKDKTVSGSAVKGVIVNGIVNVYQVESQQQNRFLTATRTDAKGEFSFRIDRNSGAVLLVEVVADEYSGMVCDLTEGCVVPSTGDRVDFGEVFDLESDFSMLGFKLPEQQTINLSPLSHVIASTAASLEGGLNYKNIEIATEWLKSDLNLDFNPARVRTPDVTDLDDDISAIQLAQGVISAAFFDYVFSDEWKNHALTLDDVDRGEIYSAAAAQAANLAALYAGQSLEIEQQLSGIASTQEEQADAYNDSQLTISSQPRSVSVVVGEAVQLRVSTTGAAEKQYQWYKGANALPNVTSNTLTIPEAALSDQGLYSVRVTDGNTTLHSLSALVTVNEAYVPFSISRQPQSQSLSPGESVTLYVEVSNGSALQYQWRKGGSILSGATGSSFTISDADSSDAGSYSVIINDDKTSISSSAAIISVTEAIAPVTIHQQPAPATVILGNQLTLSVDASGGGFISYQWQKDGVALSGENRAYLAINPAQLSDSGNYDVVVSNSQGSLQSTSAQVTVLPDAAPITILSQPQSQSVSSGDTASFSVTATSGSEIDYQWYHNDNLISGATSATLSIPSVSENDAGVYYVALQQGSQSETSLAAALTIASLKSIALNWDIPTQRENGDTLLLTEIDGYLIQYGTLPYSFEQSVRINNGSTTGYTIDDLENGIYFLRIATIDSDGVTGAFSETISIDLF